MNIGVDIIRVKRFQALQKGDMVHWKSVFTKKEWNYAFKKAGSAQRLAGIFVAKEAALKASDTRGKTLAFFEVLHTESGKPFFKSRLLKLSISHDGVYAIAVVIHV